MVSSFRTVTPCNPWEGWWIGHWKTTWSAVWSSTPHSQAAGGPYSMCTSMSGNVRHRCGGGWAGYTLSVAQPRILFRGSITWCTFDCFFPFISKQFGNWYKAPVKILESLFRRRPWPLRTYSGCDTARISWQCHSSRVGADVGESRESRTVFPW